MLLSLLAMPIPGAAAADPARRATIRALVEAAAADRYGEADRLAEGLKEPALAAYVTWRRLRDQDGREPFDAYRAFLDARPGWPERDTLQARAEAQLDGSIADAAVIAFFAERRPQTQRGRLRLARALQATGRLEEAAAVARQAWQRGGFSESDEREMLDAFGKVLRPEDHRRRMDELLWDREWTAARRLAPFLSSEAKAVMAARIALQGSAKNADALWRAVPAGSRADPGLAFDRLRWQDKRGNAEAVRTILGQKRTQLGRPDEWWTVRQRAIRERIDAKDWKTAYALASGHQMRADDKGYPDAEWLAGWLALRFLDSPQLALPHFERMWEVVSSPISRARGAYWAGRAAAAQGKDRTAHHWYRRAADHPTAFYGQLAAVELGFVPDLPGADLPVPGPKLAAELRGRDVARVAELLCGAGLADAAVPFLARLTSDTLAKPTELRVALDIAEDCGRLDVAIRAARNATRDGPVPSAASFPLPRLAELARPSRPSPEPALVLAVTRQESQFYPGAVSAAGALGLMQLMPATARTVARGLGLPYSRDRLLNNPDYNIRLGRDYLQDQIQSFGEVAMAVAAYNAGPKRVREWLDTFGDPRGKGTQAMVDWLELIPFAETRNYVQRVLEGRNVYRLLLPEARLRGAARGHPFAPFGEIRPPA